MKDATGRDLVIGQRVALTAHSEFKIGVLYKYAPNTSQYYLECKNRVEEGVEVNEWFKKYWTPERIEEFAYKYYVRFPDGKRRTVESSKKILGVPEDYEIQATV